MSWTQLETAANDNVRLPPKDYAVAAREIFEAVHRGEPPERLYWQVVDFFAAAVRAGFRLEASSHLRRLDNLLCRHELGAQRLNGPQVAALLGQWLADHCRDHVSPTESARTG